MSESSHERAAEIFDRALELTGDARVAYLGEACGDDAGLRDRVEALLRAHDRADEVVPDEPETSTLASGGATPRPPEPRLSVTRPSEARPSGTCIGPYRVLHELGKGGMGVVYLAMREGEHFKQRLALKLLKRGMDTEDILRRFDLERQVLAALNHPNIARLHDAGETDDGLPYYAMEYVEGQSFNEYCDGHRLTIEERLRLFQGVCAAVHYAHQSLVIHRDIKPGNIVITTDGTPKLLDFGIAKLIRPELSSVGSDPTAPEHRLMTPEYASPEQVRGGPITTGSDVYSLGVLLYELLTGHRPYKLRDLTRAELEQVVCDEDPDRPSTVVAKTGHSRAWEKRPERVRRRLSGDLDNIVLKAMRKEPQRRYHSAEQLSDDIERHLSGLPVTARPDTVSYRCTKFVRRNRVGVGVAAVIALLLAGGLTGTSWGWRRANEATAAESEERARAEHRYDQVRELAHTFMFDFHDAIQRLPGTIPARELLIDTALEKLEELRVDTGDDPELVLELASAYDRVGDIRGGIRNESLGDAAGAMDCYRTALELRETLAERRPGNADVALALYASRTRLGDVLKVTGDPAGALVEYEASLERAQRYADLEPPGRRPVFIAMKNVGAMLDVTGDHDAALEMFEESLDLRRDEAEENPDARLAQRDLSVGLISLGGHRRDTGSPRRALAKFEEAMRIRREVDAAYEDARSRRDVFVAQNYVAETLLDLDRADEALAQFREALPNATRRAADSPLDARSALDVAVTYRHLGETLLRLERPKEAEAELREFSTWIEALSSRRPESTMYAAEVCRSHRLLGEVAAADGDVDGAIERYREAAACAAALTGRAPDSRGHQFSAAQAERQLGDALSAAGRPGQALQQLVMARGRLTDLHEDDPDDAEVRDELRRTLESVGVVMAAIGDEAGAAEAREQARTLEDSGR